MRVATVAVKWGKGKERSRAALFIEGDAHKGEQRGSERTCITRSSAVRWWGSAHHFSHREGLDTEVTLHGHASMGEERAGVERERGRSGRAWIFFGGQNSGWRGIELEVEGELVVGDGGMTNTWMGRRCAMREHMREVADAVRAGPSAHWQEERQAGPH